MRLYSFTCAKMNSPIVIANLSIVGWFHLLGWLCTQRANENAISARYLQLRDATFCQCRPEFRLGDRSNDFLSLTNILFVLYGCCGSIASLMLRRCIGNVFDFYACTRSSKINRISEL